MTDYALLLAQAQALTEGIDRLVANLSNLSALLWESLDDINWAGFYFLEPESGSLVLGPFQGKPACVILPAGKGVCQAALAQGATLNVPDVHAFGGHIACDSASRSEIVVPLDNGKGLRAVLDIDSPAPGRFTPEDEEGLARLGGLISKAPWFKN